MQTSWRGKDFGFDTERPGFGKSRCDASLAVPEDASEEAHE